jgi:hypothetical protein
MGRLGLAQGAGVAAAAAEMARALRHEPPHVFRRDPGVAPGWPHVWLANAEGPLGHMPAPPRAILREGVRPLA